ncbi:hypothetical protein ACWCQL_10635 [Streptomyces sp. NPDC002073]
MDLTASGELAVLDEDTQVEAGIHLQQGFTLTQNGTAFKAYHALVEFASAHGGPWGAEKVKFSVKGPDGRSVVLEVDLLNDACNGPRQGLPTSVWKVVALAATAAGDVGITYATPASRP